MPESREVALELCFLNKWKTHHTLKSNQIFLFFCLYPALSLLCHFEAINLTSKCWLRGAKISVAKASDFTISRVADRVAVISNSPAPCRTTRAGVAHHFPASFFYLHALSNTNLRVGRLPSTRHQRWRPKTSRTTWRSSSMPPCRIWSSKPTDGL